MKSWLVPAFLVLFAAVGGFVIVLIENKPISWSEPVAAQPISLPTTGYISSTTTPRYQNTPPAAHDTSMEPNFITILSSSSRPTFTQGGNNDIQWEGEDLWVVDVILTDMNGNRFGYIASHDFINSTRGGGITNFNGVYWSGEFVDPTAIPYQQNGTVTIAPGEYKIVVINPVTGASSSLPITLVK